MGSTTSDPVYLRVVDDLRAKILDGSLEPGSRVPSRAAIMATYTVGETAAKHALQVLATEGLIETRPGSGSYVRRPPEIRRLIREPDRRYLTPFGWNPSAVGDKLTYEHHSEPVDAAPGIAARLAIQPGDPVMRTSYVFFADAVPFQLAESFEPLEITADTRVMVPEDEKLAGQGVIARMNHLGIEITEIVEEVHSRPPLTAEAVKLGMPSGVHVLHVERTHYAGDRPVETCDIVTPGDRFRLTYRLPAARA